ncbi:MFS transporter (plasmid) [Pseudomonas luteola]|uniref:MFS transporter n=1 Tax=Pseudomonas luteola TaxID=47886 RepID=UPI00388F670E
MPSPARPLDTITSRPASTCVPLFVAIVAIAAIIPAILMTAPAVATQLAIQWQLSPSQIGLLFSAELGAMSLATLPAYWWLSRISWRKIAYGAALVAIVGNVLSALAGDYHTLLLLRIVSALAGGSLMILCMSSAAGTANPGRAYGLWVMGQLVLGAFGLVFLPTLFARYGLAASYLILALLLMLCLPLIRAFPSGPDQPPTNERAEAICSTGKAFVGILAVLTFYISLSAVWTFVGALASDSGIAAEASSRILAIASLMGILGAGTASLIAQRVSKKPLLWLGYALLVGATLLLLDQPGLLRFAAAALIFKYTWTLVLPFILASLSDLDPSGHLMNTTNLVIGGGLAIGPFLAGYVIEHSGYQLVLIGAALISTLSLSLILIINRRVTS